MNYETFCCQLNAVLKKIENDDRLVCYFNSSTGGLHASFQDTDDCIDLIRCEHLHNVNPAIDVNILFIYCLEVYNSLRIGAYG